MISYEISRCLFGNQNNQQIEGREGHQSEVDDFVHQDEDVDWTLAKSEVLHVLEDRYLAETSANVGNQ